MAERARAGRSRSSRPFSTVMGTVSAVNSRLRLSLAIPALIVGNCSEGPTAAPSFFNETNMSERALPAEVKQADTRTLEERIKPAPAGDADTVAMSVIRDAEHPCGNVVTAERVADGSIKAVCTNGEDYRIMTVDGVGPVAMRCSAVREMDISGC